MPTNWPSAGKKATRVQMVFRGANHIICIIQTQRAVSTSVDRLAVSGGKRISESPSQGGKHLFSTARAARDRLCMVLKEHSDISV